MESSIEQRSRDVVFVQAESATPAASGTKRAAKAHTARVNWQRWRQQRQRLNKRASKDQKSTGHLTASFPKELGPESDQSHLGDELPSPTQSAAFAALLHESKPVQRQVTRQVAEHLIHVCWPEMLYSEHAISAWFQSFCQNPIIFHGFHCAASIHADVIDGKILRSASREVMVHKSIVFRMLNDMLSELSKINTKIDINIAIQSVLLLTHDEFGASSPLDRDFVLPFSPHFPTAGWPGIFGKIDTAEPHTRAMQMLVERAGGLQALTFPGLGSNLALCDLIAASVAVCPPHYPCFWQETASKSLSKGFIRSTWKGEPGRGFASHTAESLPMETLLVLQELAYIDAAMADCRQRRLHNSDYRRLIHSRNAAQHRLLNLPIYVSALSTPLEVSQSLWEAELCRITAILYSNSVMFPVPPDRPWRMNLLTSLKLLMDAFHNAKVGGEGWRLLSWSACVGALAAFESPLRDSFETHLRKNLHLHGISSYGALNAILTEFLWSPLACDHGLWMLWSEVSTRP